MGFIDKEKEKKIWFVMCIFWLTYIYFFPFIYSHRKFMLCTVRTEATVTLTFQPRARHRSESGLITVHT